MSDSRFSMNRIVLVLLCIAVAGLWVYVLQGNGSKNNIGYVDVGKLTESYNLKKDLEKQSEHDLYQIKGVIDSLKMVKKLQGDAITKVDTQLGRAQYAFKEYYQRSNQEITKKVWDRLNGDIENFGKEKHLQLLLGATGTGSLLYADKGKDMTDAVIQYVNKKYEKGN
ncbi:MAG: OmpH family outer membrane protein [Bacteroidetes bacterium]|nr:OmpH family outer membrane protein [Bacteroidota bacterium]